MTMREKLIEAVEREGYPDYLESDDEIAKWRNDILDAILTTLREPIVEWLDYQIEHGHAPDGHPTEMVPLFSEGRRSAHCGTKAMIERLFADHVRSGK